MPPRRSQRGSSISRCSPTPPPCARCARPPAPTQPFAHLHTQFNRDLPWGSIDMDFMNLNQAAHGDREAGFLHSRLRLNRKVVVGHWSDLEVQERLGAWVRAAR